MKIIYKILLSIFISAIIGFVGLYVLLLVSFSTGTFYRTLATIGIAVVWLSAIAKIWNILNPKARHITRWVIIGTMVLSIIGFEINKAYHNSFEKISEYGFDLSLYDPFLENTLAASLDRPSTLNISENPPRIDGAIALYPLYSAFAKATYSMPKNTKHGYRYDVMDENGKIASKTIERIIACTNTVGAYSRLIQRNTDIIFVAGPSEEQLQMAKDANVELKFTPIGHEAFVFFVNTENPVNNLSIADIQSIYSGKTKNWSKFGGKNSEIRAFQRPEGSGSQTMLIRFMEDNPLMTPPKEDVVSGMGGIISEVSSYRNYSNAIGYSFLFFTTQLVADKKVKLLSLNGVAPTRENVTNKTYPYTAEFYAVTAGTKNPNVEKFIQWILSEQGQSLVEKTGYTPLMTLENKDSHQ